MSAVNRARDAIFDGYADLQASRRDEARAPGDGAPSSGVKGKLRCYVPIYLGAMASWYRAPPEVCTE